MEQYHAALWTCRLKAVSSMSYFRASIGQVAWIAGAQIPSRPPRASASNGIGGSFTLTPLRILLVDDHDVIRGGLRSLLESRPNWEVCGEATTSLQAIEQTKALRPDVVVLDISMPGSSGLEAIPVIRKETPRPEVVILSRYEEREMRDRAIEAGARDYIPKSQGLARELLQAIDSIVRERSALAG